MKLSMTTFTIIRTEFFLYLHKIRFFLILSFVVAITSFAGILVEVDDPLRLFMPQALAYYLGIPTWIVRTVWFCLIFFYGAGLLAYIILAIAMPEWEQTPRDYAKITE